MQKPYTVPLGKAVQRLARLRGGGSALPGLVVEKIDPDFVSRTLKTLPRGIVVVSGSNGKTTTTKMVVELLESQGLKVFTNRTGSNFVRGVAAALLSEVDGRGRLHADIAVLELDEAHGVLFTKSIAPNFVLLLNVMRDQLDRFGEVDTVATLLEQIAARATEGVVLNRDDPRLGKKSFTKAISAPIRTFGVHPDLLAIFPSDDNLHGAANEAAPPTLIDDVSLEKFEGQKATLRFNDTTTSVNLQVNGIYNVLNAAGAVAICRMVMGDTLNEGAMMERLSTITPAFGRGESFTVHGQPLEVVLVKNPAGFRLSLSSFSPKGHSTMIAINDSHADGRDMSWLWDVDFTSLKDKGVTMVSGIRAYDMALRLQYDEVSVVNIETDPAMALAAFIAASPSQPKRIFCTYTAMLEIRRELKKITDSGEAL